jgi:hypothetical protein
MIEYVYRHPYMDICIHFIYIYINILQPFSVLCNVVEEIKLWSVWTLENTVLTKIFWFEATPPLRTELRMLRKLTSGAPAHLKTRVRLKYFGLEANALLRIVLFASTVPNLSHLSFLRSHFTASGFALHKLLRRRKAPYANLVYIYIYRSLALPLPIFVYIHTYMHIYIYTYSYVYVSVSMHICTYWRRHISFSLSLSLSLFLNMYN